MPPSRWQEAHFASRIGATSRLYVGAAEGAAPPAWATSAVTAAAARTASSATFRIDRTVVPIKAAVLLANRP